MKNAFHLDEEALQEERSWVKAAQEDPERFNKLYDSYFERIFVFIFRRIGREDLTADLCSQTFLKALQNIKKFEFRGVPFSAWLYRIASNEVNKYYRKTRKTVVFSLEDATLGEVVGKELDDLTEERLERLAYYLKELSTVEVLMIQLRFYEGRGFKEMAYILDITESAAKMRTYRAIEKLKMLFAQKKEVRHDKA